MGSHTRAPVLKSEHEVTLATKMLPHWINGLTAPEIAEKLHFGEPTIVNDEGETVRNPFAKLQTFHIWNYRTKFNNGNVSESTEHLDAFKGKFKPFHGDKSRRAPSYGRTTRYKMPPKDQDIMTLNEFRDGLNRELPMVADDSSWFAKYVHRKRALNIAFFWTPLRKSEWLRRKRKDFIFKHGFMEIHLQRLKKAYRHESDDEPFYLALSLPMVDELTSWIKRFAPDERPFHMSTTLAWGYVKDIFPNKCPHFMRFNYVTSSIEQAQEEDLGKLIRTLLEDTGMSLDVIMNYIMKNSRFKGRINALRAELGDKQ